MLRKDAKIVFVFISAMALIMHAAIAGMVAIDDDYFLEKSFAQEEEEEVQQPTETAVEDEEVDQVTDDQTNSVATPADEGETNAVQEGAQNDVLPEADQSVQCNDGEVLLDGICVSETPQPQPPTETPTPTPIEEPVDNGTDATENETETETGADDNMGIMSEEDIGIINTNNNNNRSSNTDNNNNNSTQIPTPRNNYTQVDIPQNNTNGTSTPINNPPVAIATVSKQSVCEGQRVILDASNSHDPDDGDTIVSYSWSVEETDDEDLFPRIINRDSVKTAVETRNTLNSAAGSVGIELSVKDENGTMSNDFVSFRIEKCPNGGNDDDNNNNNNNQGQQKATTTTTTIEATAECGIISETINLAGQLAPKGIRIIGFFDQCQLDMASLLLNIPNDKDLKLIAGSIDFQNAPQARDNNDAVFVDMMKMRQVSSTQGLYKTSIEEPLVGKDLVTKQPKELSNINTIVLWNDDAKDAISFGSGSAVGMSISFEK